MARSSRRSRPLIRVFFEGESEQAYALFLKQEFEDVAVIKVPRDAGLFNKAYQGYKREKRLKDELENLNEIWFFFDVEDVDRPKTDDRFNLIEKLRLLRGRKNQIRVRLLMTSGCLEYWLLLHYKFTMPPASSVADKDEMLRQVRAIVPGYAKGDQTSIDLIAENYKKAAAHGERTLKQLKDQGLPTLDDTDERNQWLCRCGLTFTTVQEAIRFLESIDLTSSN